MVNWFFFFRLVYWYAFPNTPGMRGSTWVDRPSRRRSSLPLRWRFSHAVELTFKPGGRHARSRWGALELHPLASAKSSKPSKPEQAAEDSALPVAESGSGSTAETGASNPQSADSGTAAAATTIKPSSSHGFLVSTPSDTATVYGPPWRPLQPLQAS